MKLEVVLIDVTKSPIERPKTKTILLEKEKPHSLKTQVVVNKKNKKIICFALSKGRKHDFRLFKDSRTMINQAI